MRASGRPVLRLFACLALHAVLAVWMGQALASRKLKPFEGEVVGVVDGDSLEVLRGRKPVKIRLCGIDCPEKGQPFGKAAKAETSKLAFGRRVRVSPVDIDRYGRTVAAVRLPDGRDASQELVRAGLAWWYRAHSDDPVLERLETEAREARRGLWQDPQAVPPWSYRRFRFQKPQSSDVAEAGTSPSFLPDGQKTQVAITPKGTKFHKPGCPHAQEHVEFIPVRKATSRGYEPCRTCWQQEEIRALAEMK